MPIFEYKCDDCGGEFEELVFDQNETPECPKCGSKKTAKLMSCCRFKSGGGADAGASEDSSSSSSSSSSSACSTCSGGSCSTCGL